MVTTITLSYALGFEKASKDVMDRPPRPVDEGILSLYSVFRIVYVSLLIMIPAYFLAMSFEGPSSPADDSFTEYCVSDKLCTC
jgi:magnesium-transporting ATPase (P-type)